MQNVTQGDDDGDALLPMRAQPIKRNSPVEQQNGGLTHGVP